MMFDLISMFRKRVLEGILIGACMLSVLVVLVIALSIYAFNLMLGLDLSLPLKIALCFIPIGFATLIISKIMHEILDLGIIANTIASTSYSLDFFKENPKKSSTKYCCRERFSVEGSSNPLYYCLQGEFLKNYISKQRR